MTDVIDVDAFAAKAQDWLEANREHAPRDYGAILPPDMRDEACAWQRRLFDAGFAGIHWPIEHGGQGLTPAHNAAWIRACAEASVPAMLNMVGIVLTGGALLMFGTDEQQATHLRPIITGDRVWCQLFSEPGAGSDLASLSTRAERDGDGWRLTGQKVWCSNGRVADWGICMARTNPDAPQHKGISFFLVDMRLAGIEVRPLRQMTGESEFDEVFLDDAFVPGDCLLGPEGEGWQVGMAILTNERGHIGAGSISLQRRIDSMARMGDAHGGLDAVRRDELADLVSRGRAYLAMSQRQGPVASVAASLMKLGVTEMLFDASELQTDIAGASAMLDGDAAKSITGAPGMRIAGGTTQVQKNIIGERLLGLPKEPKPPSPVSGQS